MSCGESESGQKVAVQIHVAKRLLMRPNSCIDAVVDLSSSDVHILRQPSNVEL